MDKNITISNYDLSVLKDFQDIILSSLKLIKPLDREVYEFFIDQEL